MKRNLRRVVVAIVALLAPAWFCAGGRDASMPGQLAAQEPSRGASQNPPPEDDAARKVKLLEEGIEQTVEVLSVLEIRITRLRNGVESIRGEIAKIGRAGKRPPGPGPKPPRQVLFRPPLEQFTDKKAVLLVCENNRVSLVDIDGIHAQYLPIDKRAKNNRGKEEFRFEVPGSDFRFEGSVDYSTGKRRLRMAAVRLPGRDGETLEEIQRPESRLKRKIAGRSTAEYYVTFAVWHDSFEAFLKARSLAWDAGFDVGWTPMSSGEKMELGGSGPGRFQ
jgi:uncharacterized small protein (DUF1192 family)